MVRYEFSGGKDFQAVARKLREAEQDLPAETRRAVDKAARPLPLAAKRSAILNLPRRGGLNLLVARSRFTLRRLSPTTLEIRAKGIEQLQNTNEGRVDHLTFGRRPWVRQRMPRARDWFFKPMRRQKRKVRAELEDAMHRVTRKII